MKTLLTLTILLLVAPIVLAQAHSDPSAKVKEELQKLFAGLNEAIVKKDRPTLERLYADEFQFIRPSGAVIDKAAQINGIMANDPLSSTPVPTPSFDRLLVYGDMVVSRSTLRGSAITSIFL